MPERVGSGWVARLGVPRALRFAGADDARDLPGHVRAGSGLRRWGERLVVIQDDVNALALLDERSGSVEPLTLPAGSGGLRHFSAARGNKAQKMDLEACVVLPDGRLLAMGSGSTTFREHLIVVDLGHQVRVVDGRVWYANLRSRGDFAGSELNIEGAVIAGDKLRLFQRGNGASGGGQDACNAVGDVELGAFVRWLDGGDVAPQLCAVTRFDLGHITGVPFGFTDATVLPDGRIVFLAGAEDSPDTYRDGVVLGTRVGLLNGAEFVLADVLEEGGAPTRLKLEGIDFVCMNAAGGIELVAVADMDDPDVPAVIATLVWGPK